MVWLSPVGVRTVQPNGSGLSGWEEVKVAALSGLHTWAGQLQKTPNPTGGREVPVDAPWAELCSGPNRSSAAGGQSPEL